MSNKLVIKDLSTTSIEEIVSCFLDAFTGYFVEMPNDLEYWKERFRTVRVDWKLSAGVFDEEKLVGFIINCIDDCGGIKTAFNTGTGVIEAYRGRRIVDDLYDYLFPILRAHGVQQCTLEVIKLNEKAIRVYNRIGFQNTRSYRCFKGVFSQANKEHTESLSGDIHNSWGYSDQTISKMNSQEVFRESVVVNGLEKGFVILHRQQNAIMQTEKASDVSWNQIFEPLIGKELKFINVESKRTGLIEFLLDSGMQEVFGQYLMEKKI